MACASSATSILMGWFNIIVLPLLIRPTKTRKCVIGSFHATAIAEQCESGLIFCFPARVKFAANAFDSATARERQWLANSEPQWPIPSFHGSLFAEPDQREI